MKPVLFGGRDLVAIATLAACGVWLLLALTHWSNLHGGVLIGSPWGLYSAHLGEALLFGDGVRPALVAATLALVFAACAIGYGFVVAPLWGRASDATVLLFLAGMVPGSLAVIAFTRVVTLVAPHGAAVWIIWALILAGAAGALWRGRATALRRGGFSWSHAGVAAAAIAAALVFQIHYDGFHVTGEGSHWAFKNVFLSREYGLGADARLPLASVHYDEIALLYAPVFAAVGAGPGAVASIDIAHWLSMGFGRVGMGCLAYVAVRGLGVDRLSAIILTAFAFAASLSANPASSILLFDSLSPLGYVLHISRVLGPLLPLLIVSALVGLSAPVRRTAFAVAGVAGVGLAAMPFHLVALFPWALALVGLTALNSKAAASRDLWRIATAAALIMIVAFSWVYGMRMGPDLARALTLVLAAAAPAAVMVWMAFRGRDKAAPLSRTELAVAGVLIVAGIGYFLGIAFLGNYATSRVAPFIDDIWPWRGLSVLERIDIAYVVPVFEIAQAPSCDGGVWTWRNHMPAGHCGSLPDFVRSYGLAFLAIGGVLAWRLARTRASALSYDDRALTLMLWGLALCLFALGPAFFIYDFVVARAGAGLSTWLRSRLIEPWFVSGILLAGALLLREGGVRLRRHAQGVLLVSIALFLFNPFVFSGQWIANFHFMIARLMP